MPREVHKTMLGIPQRYSIDNIQVHKTTLGIPQQYILLPWDILVCSYFLNKILFQHKFALQRKNQTCHEQKEIKDIKEVKLYMYLSKASLPRQHKKILQHI